MIEALLLFSMVMGNMSGFDTNGTGSNMTDNNQTFFNDQFFESGDDYDRAAHCANQAGHEMRDGECIDLRDDQGPNPMGSLDSEDQEEDEDEEDDDETEDDKPEEKGNDDDAGIRADI